MGDYNYGLLTYLVVNIISSFPPSPPPIPQFVVMGGSSTRMGSFAEFIAKELDHPKTTRDELSISKTDRFAFFKIGPVLSTSVSLLIVVLSCVLVLLRHSLVVL